MPTTEFLFQKVAGPPLGGPPAVGKTTTPALGTTPSAPAPTRAIPGPMNGSPAANQVVSAHGYNRMAQNVMGGFRDASGNVNQAAQAAASAHLQRTWGGAGASADTQGPLAALKQHQAQQLELSRAQHAAKMREMEPPTVEPAGPSAGFAGSGGAGFRTMPPAPPPATGPAPSLAPFLAGNPLATPAVPAPASPAPSPTAGPLPAGAPYGGGNRALLGAANLQPALGNRAVGTNLAATVGANLAPAPAGPKTRTLEQGRAFDAQRESIANQQGELSSNNQLREQMLSIRNETQGNPLLKGIGNVGEWAKTRFTGETPDYTPLGLGYHGSLLGNVARPMTAESLAAPVRPGTTGSPPMPRPPAPPAPSLRGTGGGMPTGSMLGGMPSNGSWTRPGGDGGDIAPSLASPPPMPRPPAPPAPSLRGTGGGMPTGSMLGGMPSNGSWTRPGGDGGDIAPSLASPPPMPRPPAPPAPSLRPTAGPAGASPLEHPDYFPPDLGNEMTFKGAAVDPLAHLWLDEVFAEQ